MSAPWFDELSFGIAVGAFGGGIGGTLAGIWGGLIGTFAPRGQGRAVLIPIGWAFVAVGAVAFVFGLTALLAGQPYAIWYPPLLSGGIIAFLVGALMPVVYKRYAEAEARRMQAEEFRGQ